MFLVVPVKNGEILVPDTSIACVDLRQLVASDVHQCMEVVYGELVIRLKTEMDPIVVRHTWENTSEAFRQIVNHWEEPGYLVQLWFADTDPKHLIESPAPEAEATGD